MEPQFQLEWEPRWRGLREAAAVVLRRDRSGTAPERTRIVHTRSLVISAAMHAAAVLILCFAPLLLDSVEINVLPPVFNPRDYTIYYTPEHLPALSDAGGASEGNSGRAGGAHMFHPRQQIRIARGRELSTAVVDTPHLRLPVTKKDAANLLALLHSTPHQVAFNPPRVTAIESGVHAPSIPSASQLPDLARSSATAPTLAPTPVVRTPKTVSRSVVAAAAPQVKFAAKLDLPVDSPALPVAPPKPIELRPNASRAAAAAAPKLGVVTRSGDVPVPQSPVVLPVGPSPRRGGVSTSSGATADGQLAALVIGPNPGESVGQPAGSSGAIAAMSPHGGSRAGSGGEGASAGAGVGTGTGVVNIGDGSGGGSRGSGGGATANARGGIAMNAGPGGAGSGNTAGPIAGVSISGNVVDVPSFGGGTSGAGVPRRGSGDNNAAPAVVIVGTSRAGGGLPEYGVLRGSRVYTTYIDTPRGSVVLQFADPAATSDDFGLTPPEAISTGLPVQATSLRTVISCVLDRTGAVTNVRVLEAAAPGVADAVARSLRGWRFHPALRGAHAIAVQAILGFGITTQ